MKKLIACSVFLFASMFSLSQDENSKLFEFGFYLELNRSFLETKDTKPKETSLNSSFGSGLGISLGMNFTNHISLATAAGLSFGRSSVDYQANNLELQNYDVYPLNLDFRLHGKYAFGNKTSRPYVFLGPSLMVPLDEDEASTTNFPNRTGVSIDLGVGYDKNLNFFRFSPEIRYSYGLNNINAFPVLESLYVHRVTLTLHFKD